MATYIILGTFTDQGLQNVASTAERAQEFRALAQLTGVRVQSLHWTMGEYDFVACLESDDDEALAAGLLALAAQGNARTRTLRAFDAAAMTRIAEKMQP
jgi:uncharacterized protein with GYD domain